MSTSTSSLPIATHAAPDSAELTRPGFVHDVCASVFPMGIGSPWLSRLGLEAHGLEWVQPDVRSRIHWTAAAPRSWSARWRRRFRASAWTRNRTPR